MPVISPIIPNVRFIMPLPDLLHVIQLKDWGEFVYQIEYKNYYAVEADDGELLFHVIEIGNQGTRNSWGAYALRPFEFLILDSQKQTVYRLKASIRAYFFKLQIFDLQEELVLEVNRKLSASGKLFSAIGSEKFNISGFWFYWKYKFIQSGKTICIMEQSFKKLFTKFILGNSNFKLRFSPGISDNLKSLTLASSFLLEMVWHDPNV